ncbi:MAG: ACP S-malonyltransferase, partial [Chlamydiia bacterium]|nr:ACP S-malonyltransferase [Chlamydiia bacterium]
LSKILYEGSESELTETRNSQLALYVEGIAVWRVLTSTYPINPHVAGGLSLGEYTALTAEGRLDFQTGVKLVETRAQLMDTACREVGGAMAAVIGLTSDQLNAAIATLKLDNAVWLANVICPGQLVISGTAKGVDQFIANAKSTGARKIIPLKVHGAFHSPLMASAAERFLPHCEKCPLKDSPTLHAVNVTGTLSQTNEEIREKLGRQITHPVLWEQNVRAMENEAVDLYLEIGGSGKTLNGANRRIATRAPTLSIEEMSDLIALEAELERNGGVLCR